MDPIEKMDIENLTAVYNRRKTKTTHQMIPFKMGIELRKYPEIKGKVNFDEKQSKLFFVPVKISKNDAERWLQMCANLTCNFVKIEGFQPDRPFSESLTNINDKFVNVSEITKQIYAQGLQETPNLDYNEIQKRIAEANLPMLMAHFTKADPMPEKLESMMEILNNFLTCNNPPSYQTHLYVVLYICMILRLDLLMSIQFDENSLVNHDSLALHYLWSCVVDLITDYPSVNAIIKNSTPNPHVQNWLSKMKQRYSQILGSQNTISLKMSMPTVLNKIKDEDDPDLAYMVSYHLASKERIMFIIENVIVPRLKMTGKIEHQMLNPEYIYQSLRKTVEPMTHDFGIFSNITVLETITSFIPTLIPVLQSAAFETPPT